MYSLLQSVNFSRVAIEFICMHFFIFLEHNDDILITFVALILSGLLIALVIVAALLIKYRKKSASSNQVHMCILSS